MSSIPDIKKESETKLDFKIDKAMDKKMDMKIEMLPKMRRESFLGIYKEKDYTKTLVPMSKNKLTKSLDHWSQHNPLLMAEEVFFESRGVWTGKLNFILSNLGFSLGLGNTWRFPFMCLKFGGGSFLVAYFVMSLLVGLPLLLLELCLSQFTSRGVMECWYCVPGLKGIGYSMIILNLSCCVSYTLVLGWILFYALNSMRLIIPYLTCKNIWNDLNCFPAGRGFRNSSANESSAEQFWFKFVTTRISRFDSSVNEIGDDPNGFLWYTTSCMMITWSITCVALMKGIKLSGISYVISIAFPYLMISLIIILSFRLPGSYKGFLMFVFPKYSQLLNLELWFSATVQMFFSIGIGFGGMLTMGSHNEFQKTLQKRTFAIYFVNMVSGILYGLSLFLIIGYMIKAYGYSFNDFSSMADNGAIFFIYPECFGGYKYPQLLSIPYYLMIFFMGIDSMFVMMETVITGFLDIFPAIDETKYHRICFVLLFHIICVTFSLIFVTHTGYNWFRIFEKYSTTINLLIVALLEFVVVSYIYRLTNFNRDYKMMIGEDLNIVWKVMFIGVAPPILLALICYKLSHWGRSKTGYGYHYRSFPLWADVLGSLYSIFTLLPIPMFLGWFIHHTMERKRLTFVEACYYCMRPNLKWGPLKRQKWLDIPYYRDRLTTIREETINFQADDEDSKINIVRPKWFQKTLVDKDLSEGSKSSRAKYPKHKKTDTEIS